MGKYIKDKKETILSVVIFAYNHEQYIEQTIMSVVNQETTYGYQIVVSEDCSTDNTLSIITSLQEKYPSLIKIIHNEQNLGLNKSFENSVRQSDTKYIALLGGDDYWISSSKIQKQLDLLCSSDSISFVHTSYKSLTEKTGEIKDGIFKDWKYPKGKRTDVEKLEMIVCYEWNCPLASTSCFNRDVLLKGLDTMPWAFSDSLHGEGMMLHLSMNRYGGTYGFINEDTTMYRIRTESVSRTQNEDERYLFTEQFVLLRLRIVAHLSPSEKKTNLIQKKLLNHLFVFALNLNKLERFQQTIISTDISEKQKQQLLRKCNISWFYIMKTKALSHIYKFRNSIFRFLKSVFNIRNKSIKYNS